MNRSATWQQFLLGVVYGIALTTGIIFGQPASAQSEEIGALAYGFDLSEVQLSESRLMDNQRCTTEYIKWVDPDRLLYNFPANHKLSTQDASANGGWDAPNFPFRTRAQGHFLST
jgi:hypothetical protein